MGGLPGWSPANLAFGFISFPHPPAPLPLRGRGILRLFSCKGLRPRHPCTEPSTALIVPAKQVPSAAGSLRFGAKPIEHAFLWAVPVAKERGDRGRWNYPSQATAAFEMVLSPGAGRASAVRGTPSLGHRFGKPTTQGAEGHAPAKTPLHALKNPVILLTFAPPHGIIFTRIPRITCTNI